MTKQDATPPAIDMDQILATFLLAKRALIIPLKNDEDQELYELGRPLGMLLLNDFENSSHIFFANYAMWRPEAVLWRLRIFNEILGGRLYTASKARKPRIWVAVSTPDDKRAISNALSILPSIFL